MTAPRRLQLRRGNTAAISTYVGAPGELIVNTDTNTLYLHNGVTVGGIATTVDASSILSNIATLTANAGAQAGSIATLTSNAAVQAGNIAVIFANLGAVSGSLATLTDTTAWLSGDIATLYANAGAQAGSIATLTGNAASQAGDIATIYANLGAVSGSIATLTSNAATQAGALATLTANAAVQAGLLDTLTGNAASQGGELATLVANAATQAGVLATLTSNAASQSGSLADLVANAAVQAGLIAGAQGNYSNANVASYLPTYSGNISANISKAGYTWTFGTDGTTRFPGDIILAPAGQSITMQSDQYSQLMWQNANLTVAPNMATYSNFFVGQNNATLDIGYLDGSSNPQFKEWLWGVDGSLTFPTGGNVIFDNSSTSIIDGVTDINAVGTIGANVIQVLSDLTSFGASPAPRIYGFSSIATTGSAVNEGNISASGNLVASQGAYITGNVFAAQYNFANGVNILSTVTDLYANAAVQAGNIATIFANLGATSGSLATLTANAASQAGSLATITSVLTSSNVGIGSYAGLTSQGQYAVAIGIYAGSETQGERAVAIGSNAGKTSQGAYAVAIGRRAGETNQGNNSIIINATTGVLNQTTANTFTVAPVRNDVANISQIMFYNTTSKEVTYGNTIDIAGNVSTTGYFLGNGALLTGIAASSNYSNVDVANYLPTYTGNIANIRLGTSGVLTFADGTTMTTAATGGGSDYGNANVATFLANSRTTFFGNTSTHPLSSNVTQIFIGNSTSLTSGNGTSPFAAALMYNMYFAANNASLVRNTQLGAGILSLDLNGFTVAGLATSQTANSAPTLTNLLRITSAGAATFVGTATAAGVTSTAAIAVNSALGITSNQATQLIFNQTVSTITMGGSASTINLGTTTGTAGNVFVGSTLGTNNYNLRIRANGQYNLITSLTSSGGYGIATYSNIAVTGGSGTGMIISMNGVASGYLGSANITNPGTGYVNGDTLTIPAGNPVGSLGGSFIVQNYNANRSSAQIGTGIWTYHIEGNLTAPGNITIASNSSYFIGNTLGTTAAYTGNVSAANFIGNTTGTTATYTGNVTAQNFIGNISITGNVTGTSSNVTLQAGSYSSTFDNQGNVTFPGNVNVSGLGVTMPNRPAFRVNGTSLYSGAQSTANVNLRGVAVSTQYNQGNYFDAATGKFTAPVAGIYEVLLNARVNSTFNGLAQLVVLKNGLNTAGNVVAFWETTSNIGGATHFGVSGTVVLATGDYLSANILSGNVTFDANDNWSVTYLG